MKVSYCQLLCVILIIVFICIIIMFVYYYKMLKDLFLWNFYFEGLYLKNKTILCFLFSRRKYCFSLKAYSGIADAHHGRASRDTTPLTYVSCVSSNSQLPVLFYIGDRYIYFKNAFPWAREVYYKHGKASS